MKLLHKLGKFNENEPYWKPAKRTFGGFLGFFKTIC